MAGREYSNAGNKKGNMTRVGFPLPRRKPRRSNPYSVPSRQKPAGLKPREELNIGPATPIGRGSQPLDPRAHRVARDVVGSVASMGALGIAGRIGQAANLAGRFSTPTRAAWRAAGVPMRNIPRGGRVLTPKRKK